VNTLHWSLSRSQVRTSVAERDENQIERRLARHHDVCACSDSCGLSILESALVLLIEFAIERPTITRLSMPVR
jgi:hypothetical protein